MSCVSCLLFCCALYLIPIQLDAVSSPHLLFFAMQDGVAHELWIQASNHFQGGGLEHGIAYGYSMQTLNYYRKNKIYDKAAAACWSIHRLFAANMIPESEDVCPLCGATPCDDFHQYWACPNLADSESVSFTHLLAHEPPEHLFSRLLLFKKTILHKLLRLLFLD